MINYLSGSTWLDIAMAVHQVARFSICPKRSHKKAVIWITQYLRSTTKFRILYKLDLSTGLEVYVDTDFAGLWTQETVLDPNSILSYSGFIILLFGCLLFWYSKLQTEIALSTTEAEYIAMSQALRSVIPLINLMNKLIPILDMLCIKLILHFKVYEDNQFTIAITKASLILPRTKHISLKYHHFHQFVLNGAIDIKYICTEEQIGDIFTKPLPPTSFTYLRHKMMGW